MSTTNSLFLFSSVFTFASCSKAEDMVVAASQNPPGAEPYAQSIPSGVTPVQGARHAGPTPYRGPNPNHLERQQQGNWPFFYVQPSQPYLPCQWPMPLPYIPYGGLPGLGRWSEFGYIFEVFFYKFITAVFIL